MFNAQQTGAHAGQLMVCESAGLYRPAEDAEIMDRAERILRSRVRGRKYFTDAVTVKNFLRTQMGHLDHEVFAVLYLDSQHRLLDDEVLFRGTLTQTSVYPREVVKQALMRNAAAVVLAHNHPSGEATPSRADEALTRRLKDALGLIDVRVLDHVVVTAQKCLSMAEEGLL